ncbi:MAG: hypothetical protein WA949_22915 [Phormidesmis sp.]
MKYRALSLLICSFLLTATACAPTANPTQQAETIGDDMPAGGAVTDLAEPSAYPVEETSRDQLASEINVTTSIDSEANAYETTPNQLLIALGQHCEPRTEVGYRSRILTALDGRTKVYAEGTLIKTISAELADRETTSGYCFSSSRETVGRQVVFQQADSAKRAQLDSYDSGHIIFQPRSFSGGSSYLVGQSTIEYQGGDGSSYVSIYSTATGELDSSIKLCESFFGEDYGSEYLGFSSPAEFVISCYGNAVEPLIEVVNLETGTVESLSERPAALVDYGTLEGSFRAVER